MTHIAQCRVDDVPHLRNSPFHDVAEMFIVDVVVLLSNRPLSTFLEFVLTVTARLPIRTNRLDSARDEKAKKLSAHTLTRQSFDRTAMSLLSSFD
jgi:hypothetical protein